MGGYQRQYVTKTAHTNVYFSRLLTINYSVSFALEGEMSKGFNLCCLLSAALNRAIDWPRPQAITTACLEEGQAHFGPTSKKVCCAMA